MLSLAPPSARLPSCSSRAAERNRPDPMDCWRPRAPNRAWAAHGAGTVRYLVAMANGRVLAAGGVDDFGLTVGPAEVYDPQTDAWHTPGSLTDERSLASTALLNGGQVPDRRWRQPGRRPA